MVRGYAMKKETANIILSRLQQKNSIVAQSLNKSDISAILDELELLESEIIAQNDEIDQQSKQISSINLELDTLFYNAPIPYVVLNEELKILKKNHTFNQYFQFPFNPNLSLFFTKIIEFEDYKKFILWFKSKDFGKKSIGIKLKSKNKIKQFEIFGNQYLNEENENTFLLTLVDIDFKMNLQSMMTNNDLRYKTLLNVGSDGIHVLDIRGNLIEYNNAFANMLGYEPKQMKYFNISDWDQGISIENMYQGLQTLKDGSKTIQTKYKKQDGSVIDVQVHAKGIFLEDRFLIYCSARDITKHKNLERFVDTQDNIIILTNGEKLTFANKKFFDYFGFDSIESFEKHHKCICEFFIENDRFFHLGKLKEDENWVEVIRTLPHTQRIVSMLAKDFVPHAFSVGINDYDENTLILSFSDISQTILEKISLEHKTLHDKLTGAFNREFFEQNYSSIISNAIKHNKKLALCVLDIDHFKLVNDNYGHDVGDEVLKHFVKVVEKFSRKDDMLVRWGGEEFILLMQVNSQEDLAKALEHIRKVIEMESFPIIGNKTCSIGATLYNNNEQIDNTIKRADEAVYEAKSNGRNNVVVK